MAQATSSRRFRFPDHAWWKKRSAHCPIPRYYIERRPENAKEYGTDVEGVVCRMIRRIAGRFDPIAIWMLGSMARGDCGRHSDVDLMVIMPEGTDRESTELAIRMEVTNALLPKDILVNTPCMFRRRMHDLGSIQHAVHRHGVMLYG